MERIDEIHSILSDIETNLLGVNFFWRVGEMGDGHFIQSCFRRTNTWTHEEGEGHGRKWYISRFATKSEIVLTAFKAFFTNAEHECREGFKYRGESILAPHFDVDAMAEFASRRRVDVRA